MMDGPNPFGNEVLSGFKRMFGKFFGTNHLVKEGWLSYQKSMLQSDGDAFIEASFYYGAIAMFAAMLEMGRAGDVKVATQMIEHHSPDKLWQKFRNDPVGVDINPAALDRYKKAFYGGCWFINALWFTARDVDSERVVETMAAVQDEFGQIKGELERVMRADPTASNQESVKNGLRRMDHFAEPIDLVLKSDKKALLKWCFNRCCQAFNLIYENEQTKMGSLWNFDDRYYEHGVRILYERFCFAMAIIVGQFHVEWIALYDATKDARIKSLSDITFGVALNVCADEVFKLGTRDMGSSDGTEKYGDADYTDDEYERFWERHRTLQADVTALRNSFSPRERDYLHGFTDADYTEADDDPTWNLDCVHVMRVYEFSGDMDVAKFLGDTKRYYLPTIITAFMTTPNVVTKAPRSMWWQFRKK
jgi:hypothetical protein